MIALLIAAASALAPKLVTGREAVRLCSPVAELCAEAILSATERTEKAILTSALDRDLRQRITGKEGGALWVVQDDSDSVIGSVAIEVRKLSPAALDAQRLRGQGTPDVLQDRPLLSSLAVSSKFRKRGLAKKLCRAAEVQCKEWGFDEILLRVERDNGKARNLYRKLGYRVVAVDKEAERPIAGPGGLKYVPTVQVAMRKSLRYPPKDSVVGAVLFAAFAAFGFVNNEQVLTEAFGLAADGNVADAAKLLFQLISAAAEQLPFR